MSFHKLRVYQAAAESDQRVKALLPSISWRFKNDKQQLDKASSSVPYNIAEAYGLERPGRKISHLEIARGSIDETHAALQALLDAGAIRRADAIPLLLRARAIAKMLTSLINRVREKD